MWLAEHGDAAYRGGHVQDRQHVQRIGHTLGITLKRLRALVRIRYVKVAEYQARGAVHFHAVIRLDVPGQGYQPPPPVIDAAALCNVIGQAAGGAWSWAASEPDFQPGGGERWTVLLDPAGHPLCVCRRATLPC